jgi:copper resistance protein B
MKRWTNLAAATLASATLLSSAVSAEPVVWAIQAEQLEYRVGEGSDIYAWDAGGFVGKDELRLVWRSEAEYAVDTDDFETLENQFRLQRPISDFFDAVAGVRFDTPQGPDRVYGVLGFHGLAPQWFEVDLDLFLSEYPSLRFEVEYEALITNRLILTPSFEIDIPLNDDRETGQGGFGPTVEIGARLSYDLIDRAVSPYIGVHWERSFGETATLARAEGEEASSVYIVAGLRLLF